MSQVAVFNGTAFAVKEYNTGRVARGLLPAGQWKEMTGRKGADAKRGYNEYCRARGLAANQALAGWIAGGTDIVTKVVTTKTGCRTIHTVPAARFADKVPARKVDLSKADLSKSSTEELRALVARISEHLANA